MKAKIMTLAGMGYLYLNSVAGVHAQASGGDEETILVNSSDIGFRIPNMSEFLSFMIKFFFVLAGLLALFYMLWGALSWVTSGGSEDAVAAARKKIIAAVVGVILIVATLSIIAGLEQIVFKQRVCFGLTCPLTLPDLLEAAGRGPDGRPNSAPDEDRDGDGILNRYDCDKDNDEVCAKGEDCEQVAPDGTVYKCDAGPDEDDYDDTKRGKAK